MKVSIIIITTSIIIVIIIVIVALVVINQWIILALSIYIAKCPIGEMYDSQSKICAKCPIGTYQEFEGKAYCTACPRGTTTLGNGATDINYCKGLYSYAMTFTLY